VGQVWPYSGQAVKLLQDDGKEMIHNEIIQYLEPMKRKKRKKKYKNIAHGGYFYPQLYSLAGSVLALLETKRLEYFPCLPASQKNMSNTIHIIGKMIAHQQFSCTRGDVHSIGVDGGLMDLINSVLEYAGRQRFYILSQQKLLELLLEKYGVEGETKEATTDDKIQVASIVFSELCEYMTDMFGSSRESKIRAELYTAASRKLAGFCAMYTKFIDKEVIVTLPEKWTLEDTKCSIDGLTHPDLYEQYETFDPNNVAQIALNWTQKGVSGIFGMVVLEYQECRKRYTMRTGGGPGAPKNFATWETWDESYVSLYMQQDANISCGGTHLGQAIWFSFCSKRRFDAGQMHD
jgi:hypothetical protein